jgi:hypothetical protein
MRAFTRLCCCHHWVKVAGGDDASLRKIKIVPPGYEMCGEQRARALCGEVGTRTADLGALIDVNRSSSNVASSR